jgi:signal transduction histidine kinase/response regulator RpfG family c-di-GMP phosphodiesterase
MERKFDILIVDDDEGLALNLRDILEEQGYSVAVTYDGQTALTLSRQKIFDLAIIDFRLPDIPGDVVINKLSGISPRTEYILITGYASLESAVEAVRWKNIISYEIKPFDVGRLIMLIDQVTQRKRAEEDVLRQKTILEAINKMLLEALRCETDEEVAHKCLAVAQELTGSKFGFICEVNQAGRLHTIAVNDSGWDECRMPGTNPVSIINDLKISRIQDRLIKEERSLIFNDLPSHPDWVGIPEDHPAITCFLGVPLKQAGHMFGLIGLANKESAYDEASQQEVEILSIAFVEALMRKRAEKEMATLQEQLRQSQKMEAMGRLAGGIAHDFNNLLTIIKGYSQLLLVKNKEGTSLEENIEQVKQAADRAADLTRQLLAFSRRQLMEMRVLDLNTVLRNLDKMLRRVLGEDVKLVTLLAEDLGRVKTDPGQIEQVVMNLAVNARDAMPSGGRLTIETANVDLDEVSARARMSVPPGRYVMLSVSDDGIGMTQEVKERVFEPFFTTKERGKGTGLGLSTVYGIVKQSGGNIWVCSEPGKGTTFKIYLQRVDEPLEELREKMVGEELPRGKETVLVVEDEEKVRKLIVEILGRQGYRVIEASHGDEALLIHAKHDGPIHLILVDVVMPGMSGSELTKRLASVRPETKILYMSGYTDNAIVHHGVLARGVNYIQKPFTMDGLTRKVREVLHKYSKPAG